MNFENTRTCEMLDAAVLRGKKAKLIAAAASSLSAHQAAIAMLVGRDILGERAADVRTSFSLIAKILVAATCETEDDVKTFTAMEDAVFKDLADMRQQNDH